MKTLYKLPLVLFLLVPSILPAQKRWSLEECIRYAWDNNLRIKQQELVIEQNANNVVQSKMAYLPSFRASVSHNMNWGRSVNMNDLQIIKNQLSQSTSASLGASLPIFEGMQRHNDVKSKEITYKIAIQDKEKLRNDISIEISRSYLQILLSRDILKTAQVSLSSMEEQRERTKKLVDAGSQAYSALLEIESQLASERVQVVNSQNQLRTNLLSLKQLLDLPGDENFDIIDQNVDALMQNYSGESVESLFRRSLDLPQIKGAQLGYDNSKVSLAMAKGRLYPSLSFSAGYGSYFSDSRSQAFFIQFNENRNPSIGFSLSIPIFSSLSARTAVKNARLGVKNAQLEVKTKEQMLYKEIQQADNDAISLFEKLKASQKNVKAMEESFRYVQQKFEVGVLNATDYTVAKTNLFKAQSEYYQAKYQYIFQLKIIDFYKGNPLTL